MVTLDPLAPLIPILGWGSARCWDIKYSPTFSTGKINSMFRNKKYEAVEPISFSRRHTEHRHIQKKKLIHSEYALLVLAKMRAEDEFDLNRTLDMEDLQRVTSSYVVNNHQQFTVFIPLHPHQSCQSVDDEADMLFSSWRRFAVLIFYVAAAITTASWSSCWQHGVLYNEKDIGTTSHERTSR